MSTQNISMFVSHKIEGHKRAAIRIKEILEARTERLEVHVCEEIDAGDSFKKWIQRQIESARLMLVLLPRGTTKDTNWISYEMGAFQGKGRLIALKHAADPIPSIIDQIEVVDGVKDSICEKLLEPLFKHDHFAGENIKALNERIARTDIVRDAEEIEDAFAGLLPTRTDLIGASLIVEGDDFGSRGVGSACISASQDFAEILDWQLPSSATWMDLKERALQQKGKGTFWADEMASLMTAVAQQQSARRIISSTFRGRGSTTAGRIFRPVLDRVDYVDDNPVRFRFAFYEVLVPELVRPKGPLGDVTNLLYMAMRMRWEVLYPFLIKRLESDGSPDKWQLSAEDQRSLIGNVLGSLRAIELQIERHHMLDSALSDFEESNWRQIVEMLNERRQIVTAIEAAGQQNDFAKLMEELKRAVELNSRVMQVLTNRFAELMAADNIHIQRCLVWPGGSAVPPKKANA